MSDPVYVFVSPHLDDVVFSCGGYVHQLISQGHEVVIATVITADDESGLPLSWLAQRNLRSWGGKKDIFALRCAEDLAAASKLGAKVMHLGLLDCIYRRDTDSQPLYNKRVVNVPVHETDWQFFEPLLEKRLEMLLRSFGDRDVLVVGPLTIGGHVDHLIVRQAVEAVTSAQQRLYYEDFPYTLRLESSHDKTKDLVPVTINLSPEDVQARLAAATCYHSQIPGLFPSRLEIIQEILQARLPFWSKYYSARTNPAEAVDRMRAFIERTVRQVGGERVWAYGNQVSDTRD